MRLSSLQRVQKTRPEAARQELHEFTFPAPTGGWNARDPLLGMKPNDAIVLDNYFPSTADVMLRGGHSSYATGLGSFDETMMPYSKTTTNKLFAIAGTSIFDVSAAGAVGAAAVTGLTNARWQHVNFTTSGGAYLVLVNGTDSLYEYDGTTWTAITGVSTPAITGIATTALANVFVFKKRLFFIEKDKLKLWSLAVDSISGAASAFDISAQFKKGGYLVAGGSLTRDGGDGMDDLFVVVTSNGEVAIYQGTDPGVDFLLIGRYDIGAPIGRRCLTKFGSDLIVLTLDGAIALSKILTLDASQQADFAVTGKIRNAFSTAAVAFKSNFGWEIFSYPGGSRLMFNVPLIARTIQHQYTQNVITGAWCRFTGMNAGCWALYNERAYFGGNNGVVYLSDEGYLDNNGAITGQVQTAFNYLDKTFHTKHVKLTRFNFITDPALTYDAKIVVDFNAGYAALSTGVFNSTSGSSRWDVATWDIDPWETAAPLAKWRSLEGIGSIVSVALFTNTLNVGVKLNSIDLMYTRGGAI